jgi:hypothetical protein
VLGRFLGFAGLAIATLACGEPDEMASLALSPSFDAGEGNADHGNVTTVDADTPSSLLILPAEFTEESTPMRMLANGDGIDLWRAPQGGHVVLIAAQVKNMTTRAAALRVRMRRPDTGFIVAEESRTIAMVAVDGEPGIMQPDIRSRTQVAHVPLCPDYDAIDIVDQPLQVEIEMTALYTDPPVSGTATVLLTPRCGGATADAGSLCHCECTASYALGKCGRNGAGAVDAGDSE